MGIVQAIGSWFTTPFRSPADPLTVVEMVGIVLIAFFLWSRVLAHLHLE